MGRGAGLQAPLARMRAHRAKWLADEGYSGALNELMNDDDDVEEEQKRIWLFKSLMAHCVALQVCGRWMIFFVPSDLFTDLQKVCVFRSTHKLCGPFALTEPKFTLQQHIVTTILCFAVF